MLRALSLANGIKIVNILPSTALASRLQARPEEQFGCHALIENNRKVLVFARVYGGFFHSDGKTALMIDEFMREVKLLA